MKQKRSIKFLWATVFFILFLPFLMMLIVDDLKPDKLFDHEVDQVFNYIEWIFATLFLVAFAKPLHKLFYSTVKGIFTQSIFKFFNVRFLLTVAIYIAYIYSLIILIYVTPLKANPVDDKWPPIFFFETVVILIYSINVADQLKNRNDNKINQLLAQIYLPKENYVYVKNDNKVTRLNLEDVKPDSFIVIQHDTIIPVDGIVFDFDSIVNEKLLNGSKTSTVKMVGDKVYAGSKNVGKTFTLKTTCTYKESKVNKMMEAIEHTAHQSLKLQKVEEKLVAFYMPIVFLVAIATLVIWTVTKINFPWMQAPSWTKNVDNPNVIIGITNFVAILAIAIPMGFVTAGKLVIRNSVLSAAQKQIIIKNTKFFEQIQDIKYAIFDRAGTLTYGDPTVKAYYGDEKYQSIIYSMESYFSNSYSKAICKYIKKTDRISLKVKEFKDAITTTYKEKKFYIGKHTNDLIIPSNFAQIINATTNNIIYVAENKEVVALLEFEDQIQDSAYQTIEFFKANGITPILVSGSSQKFTEKIAQELCFKEYHFDCSDEEKTKIVESYCDLGLTMYIGDGINDSSINKKAALTININPALDSNSESDIEIHRTSLIHLIRLINIAYYTRKNINYNFIIEVVFGFIVLILCVFGMMVFTWMIGIFTIISDLTPFLVTTIFSWRSKNTLKLQEINLFRQK